MVRYTGRGLVVKRPGVLSKVQMLTLVLGVGVFSLLGKKVYTKGVFSSENSSASTGKKGVLVYTKSLFSREKEGKYIYTKEASRGLWGTPSRSVGV